jgi:hypothetical protein
MDKMTKAQCVERLSVFTDCLALLYKEVNINYPKRFFPEIEAERIINAFKEKHAKQCEKIGEELVERAEITNYCAEAIREG